MHDHYYDPHPRILLEQPLCLIGFMGSGVSRTAHALASRVGLPLQDLDRIVEHAAGMTRALVLLSRGVEHLRTLEAAQLARILPQRPCAVIALSDGALLDDDARALVTARAKLVYVHRPLSVLQRTVQRELEQNAARYPELSLAAPHSPQNLRPLLDARASGYARANLRIDAERESPQRVAERIAAALGWP